MKRIFDQQHKNHYDMVIVGGGISGAFVAYEAASRGLKVALFEKGDFGEATSAATSKLIHGGLRYLANLEFGLVRESLIERRVLENIAPNFVYPLPMLIPTYKNIKSSKYLLTAGMLLYDLLSFDKSWTWDDSKKIPMHRTIGKKKTKLLAPLVPQRKLSGSSIFYDCQNINPERLTLGVIKSAASYGAHMANYAKMEQLIVESEIVKGVIVKDLLSGKSHKIDADITINATGPWSDIVLKTTGNLKNIDHHIRRSEGIHLIVKKMVDDHAITIVTKKKRHVFMLPWRNHTIIGTTDKAYSGKPDDYSVSEKSIAELLEEINASLDKQYHISKKDILYSYGGMRPLVEKETEGTYNASRRYELYDNSQQGLGNLFSVEGGKYTTSRHLAENLLKKIGKKKKRDFGKSITKDKYLQDSSIKDMEGFIKDLEKEYPQFSPSSINYIGRNYGERAHDIFKLAINDETLKEVLTNDGEILAEVRFVLENEMVFHLSDVFFRRTGIGSLGFPGKKVFNKVVDLCQHYLNWTEEQKQAEINQVMKQF